MAETTLPQNPIDDLIPLTQWPKRHPWPPLGGLRHLVFHEKTNGFDKVIRRVGKRILISEAAFRAWVEKQNTPAPTGK